MFILLIALFHPQLSFAQPCDSFLSQLPHPLNIQESQKRALKFQNVEVFRRNNSIGIQQIGDLQLERWIEVGPFIEDSYNFIGLTSDGRIYQIVDWHGERRVARLLSGEQHFEDIFLIEGQVIAAHDIHKQIWFYSPVKWSKSPRRHILKKGLTIWAGMSAILTAGIYMLVPDASQFNFEVLSIPIPLPAVFTTIISGLQTGFVLLNQYDRSNTFPDGFVASEIYISPTTKDYSQITAQSIFGFDASSDLKAPSVEDITPPLPLEGTENIR